MVPIAVEMTASSGRAASLVNNPSNTSRPHAISKPPTTCAVTSGYENPIFANLIAPSFASVYLRTPCVRKINPTASLMNSTHPVSNPPG